MGNKRINDLESVETEHLIGDGGRPIVKFRAESVNSVLVGQMDPTAAREIAVHLFESAARAEYESDLYRQMKEMEWKDEMIAGIFHMVRTGEMVRHTNTEGM